MLQNICEAIKKTAVKTHNHHKIAKVVGFVKEFSFLSVKVPFYGLIMAFKKT